MTTECQCAGVWHTYSTETVDGVQTDCIYRVERTLEHGWSLTIQYPRLKWSSEPVKGFPTLRSALDCVHGLHGVEDSLLGDED